MTPLKQYLCDVKLVATYASARRLIASRVIRVDDIIATDDKMEVYRTSKVEIRRRGTWYVLS